VNNVQSQDTKVGCLAVFLILAMLVTAVVSWNVVMGPSPPSSPRPPFPANEEAILSDYTAHGLIRIDTGERKGWVDPTFWVSLDADKKEKLTELMAAKCGYANKINVSAIDLYDMQSARKIAAFDPLSGFEVY
jgi:hypothetical protein